MKNLWMSCFAGLLALTTAAQAADGWETDFDAAKEIAKKENKVMLVDFTGSDWCGWCIKLDKEVFSQPAFQEYAKANLVLVKVDFPRRTPLGKEEQERNQKLQEKYQVNGFPTVILFNSKGKEIARTGYQPGGAESYVEHLQSLTGHKGKKKPKAKE